MKLDGVAAFVAVVDAGSISEAGRRLGLSKSVVSERLAELERMLGARLMQRTTRKLSLTEDGAAFLTRARRIVHNMDEAVAELAERRGTLVGPLRLSAPTSFGSLHLGPALYPFLRDNPGVQLTLDLDDRFVDVAADGYDAVIRHGPVDDAGLNVRRLASSRRVLVAAPSFLAEHGTPRSLAELEHCKAILYANRNADWRFIDKDVVRVVRPSVSLRVNNGIVMRDAALAGLGMTLLPTFMIQAELTSGALLVIDPGAKPEGVDVIMAYPAQLGASAKLRALFAWLRRAFGDPPYWERGLPGAAQDDGREAWRIPAGKP